MKTTNKQASTFVNAKQKFEASNLNGIHKGTLYIVYSYGWYPLFVYSREDNIWLENSDKYSPSTSRQQSQSRPDCETVKVTHEGLRNLIAVYGRGEIRNIA
jgi:hypothetical protein